VIPLPHNPANSNFRRMMRVYRYFRDNDGWVDRDRVMHWTGFPRPSDQPVIAYVEFANTLMRLNRIIAKSGRKIVGGLDTGEKYRMEAA
jgi:hypothetical protein